MIRNIASGVQSFTSNAFLVVGERTVLVDTGSNFDAVGRVEELAGGLDAVVLTHTHPDHVGNVETVKDTFDVEAFGFDANQHGVDVEIEDDETVALGDDDYRALHTPGHKNDHLCFYSESAGVLFAGDLVFQNGSFGRTDLEEGDRETLVRSIDRVLAAADEELREMHTGHGPSVTTNPYHDIELASQTARMY
ncbi:MBL fold metallo-hydrolase [Haladaptatus halobius]|jgi:hydroxyacylglutathione hydrolase|uniref:MBL fold metallo-hydrolase n=1 Tax=Haladaptatus halobius TaxID=2884875 RepID=UPI001D0A72D3|nr:MBL fold metallo-hydrolase [Haladaptatus halobius]